MRKNFLFTLLGVLGMALGLSSCKKCTTCTYTGGGTTLSEEMCKDDFNTEDQYNQTVAYYVANGYHCD